MDPERFVADLALEVGKANPGTRHVYIDGNDACLAVARTLANSDWLADLLREAKAEAWDEGHDQDLCDEGCYARNPYRD